MTSMDSKPTPASNASTACVNHVALQVAQPAVSSGWRACRPFCTRGRRRRRRCRPRSRRRIDPRRASAHWWRGWSSLAGAGARKHVHHKVLCLRKALHAAQTPCGRCASMGSRSRLSSRHSYFLPIRPCAQDQRHRLADKRPRESTTPETVSPGAGLHHPSLDLHRDIIELAAALKIVSRCPLAGHRHMKSVVSGEFLAAISSAARVDPSTSRPPQASGGRPRARPPRQSRAPRHGFAHVADSHITRNDARSPRLTRRASITRLRVYR